MRVPQADSPSTDLNGLANLGSFCQPATPDMSTQPHSPMSCGLLGKATFPRPAFGATRLPTMRRAFGSADLSRCVVLAASPVVRISFVAWIAHFLPPAKPWRKELRLHTTLPAAVRGPQLYVDHRDGCRDLRPRTEPLFMA